MVDNLQIWWKSLPIVEQQATVLIQLKIDNGPESGIRTQFLRRMVDFADEIGIPIQLPIIRLIIVNIIPLSGAGEF
jgi:hypothetical protein